MTTDERVSQAARAAYAATNDAIAATRFAVGLETRLHLQHETGPMGEYLVAALAALHDVRDTLDAALTHVTEEAP